MRKRRFRMVTAGTTVRGLPVEYCTIPVAQDGVLAGPPKKRGPNFQPKRKK
jgi:hypothetical protein